MAWPWLALACRALALAWRGLACLGLDMPCLALACRAWPWRAVTLACLGLGMPCLALGMPCLGLGMPCLALACALACLALRWHALPWLGLGIARHFESEAIGSLTWQHALPCVGMPRRAVALACLALACLALALQGISRVRLLAA